MITPKTKLPKQCTCGASNTTFCKNCSALKVVFNLKTGWKVHYQGKNVIYSYLSKNQKSLEKIATGIYNRYKTTALATQASNNVQFYDNQSGELLHQIKL